MPFDSLFLPFFLLAGLFWFVASLILYLRRDKQNEKQTKGRRIGLILSSCVFGAVILSVVALTVLILLAIEHM